MALSIRRQVAVPLGALGRASVPTEGGFLVLVGTRVPAGQFGCKGLIVGASAFLGSAI